MNDLEQTGAGPYWTALTGDVLYWESWGEQHAVFDVRSGETHLLPDTTAQVLQQLKASPGTAGDLAHALCIQSHVTCDQRYVDHIAALLRQLHALGLIEKTTT